MKRSLPLFFAIVFALTALTRSAGSAAQEGRGGSDLAALEARVAALEAQDTEQRLLLERAYRYIEGQSKAAGAVLRTLDAAQQAGFTKGINFRSRELLLEGFRSYWKGLEKDAPRWPSKPATIKRRR